MNKIWILFVEVSAPLRLVIEYWGDARQIFDGLIAEYFCYMDFFVFFYLKCQNEPIRYIKVTTVQ